MFSGVSLLDGLDRLPGGKLVQSIIGGIVGLLFLFRSFYFVQQGETAFRVRFGKIIGEENAKELPPGLVWTLPVFHKLVRISQRDRTTDLSLLTIQWDVAWEARFAITFNVFKGVPTGRCKRMKT